MKVAVIILNCRQLFYIAENQFLLNNCVFSYLKYILTYPSMIPAQYKYMHAHVRVYYVFVCYAWLT